MHLTVEFLNVLILKHCWALATYRSMTTRDLLAVYLSVRSERVLEANHDSTPVVRVPHYS